MEYVFATLKSVQRKFPDTVNFSTARALDACCGISKESSLSIAERLVIFCKRFALALPPRLIFQGFQTLECTCSQPVEYFKDYRVIYNETRAANGYYNYRPPPAAARAAAMSCSKFSTGGNAATAVWLLAAGSGDRAL